LRLCFWTERRADSTPQGENWKTKLRKITKGFDSVIVACNDVWMPNRNLKIVRFIGSTPSLAYCDVCRLAFRTRQEFLIDDEKAKQQLQSDFDKHECKPEAGAVNEALDDIR
jgi:hypothetical protein